MKGNMDCLEFIFKRYNTYCIDRLIKFRNCPREIAEDLFVDAVLNFRDKVISKEIEHLTNLRGYIYGTCVNMYKASVQKNIRASQKAKKVIDDIYVQDHEAQRIEFETREELSELAVSTLESLNESCQKLLKYFYVHQLSMQEIADQMGLASRDVAKTKRLRCYKKWISVVREFSKYKV